MEKQKLSGKTILKLVGALLALAYLGFCLYAGITGKFPNMHKAEHVMRFGDLKNWVSGGISAVMIFALCITAFGVLSGYWLDRDCPLCRYCSFSIWSCMDSTTVESVDRPPTFA